MSQEAIFGELYFRNATDKDRDDIVEAFFTYLMQGNWGSLLNVLLKL